MSQYVTLVGAEQVERAGHNINGAGADMNRAAGTISDAAMQLCNNLLPRLEECARVTALAALVNLDAARLNAAAAHAAGCGEPMTFNPDHFYNTTEAAELRNWLGLAAAGIAIAAPEVPR